MGESGINNFVAVVRVEAASGKFEIRDHKQVATNSSVFDCADHEGASVGSEADIIEVEGSGKDLWSSFRGEGRCCRTAVHSKYIVRLVAGLP